MKVLFFLVAIFIIILCLRNRQLIEENFRKELLEKFQVYMHTPNVFGEMDTGSDPINFYRYDRYRKPYMWPRKIFSEYPYPHMDNCEEVL